MDEFIEPAAPEPQAEPAPEPQAEPQADLVEPQATAEPKPKPEPKAEPKKRGRREALEAALAKVDEGERPRNPDGTFRSEATDAEPKAEPKPDAAPDPKAEAKPEAKPASPEPKVGDAPARFSADAKAEWDKAPPSVKGEALRAIRELESGIEEKNRILDPIKPLMKKAQDAGLDLLGTVQGYVTADEALMRDPVGASLQILSRRGVTPHQMLGEMFRRGYIQVGQDGKLMPQQQPRQKPQQQPQQQPIPNQVEQRLAAMEQKQAISAAEMQVEAFSAKHPRMAEDAVQTEMVRLLETGYARSLEDAYAAADRLHPAATPAPVPATPQVQTLERKAVTGAPASGSNPVARKPSASRTEALKRAMSQVGLS